MQVLNEPGKKQRIEVLAFSPASDNLLAAGNGSWLTVWQLAGAAPLCRVFETDNSYAWVVDAGFIGDGKAVAATCGTDGLRIHPIIPDSGFRPTRLVWGASLWGFAISPDGRRVIASTGCLFFPPPPGEHGLVSWRAGAGNRFRRDWSVSFERSHGSPTFLPDGREFMAHEYPRGGSAERCTLVVRSAESGEKLETYACPYAYGSTPVLSPAGGWVVVMSSMGLAIRSSGDLHRKPLKISNDNRKHFTGLAFHPSGRYLAATSNDATVKLYDTASWQLARTFTWDVGRMRSIAFSPDGTLAAAGSDTGKIVVWDVDV